MHHIWTANELRDLLIASFLCTPRQQRIGARRTISTLPCVHYEYVWQGTPVSADNVFALGSDPAAAVLDQIAPSVEAEHQLLVLDLDAQQTKTYRRGGYAVTSVDYLMALALPTTVVPQPHTTPISIQRGNSSDLLALWNGVRAAEPYPAEDRSSTDIVYYVLLVAGQPVVRANTVRFSPALIWVSNVFTDPAQRQRGLARQLMQQVLADSNASNASVSMLLSTKLGQPLYTQLGYQTLATVSYLKPAK